METTSNSASEMTPGVTPGVAIGTSAISPLSSTRQIPQKLIERIVVLSATIFPGPVSFEFTSDPESPSDEYVVFDVVATGEFSDYRERIIAWHDEVDKIVPNSGGAFRLIVHPQP